MSEHERALVKAEALEEAADHFDKYDEVTIGDTDIGSNQIPVEPADRLRAMAAAHRSSAPATEERAGMNRLSDAERSEEPVSWFIYCGVKAEMAAKAIGSKGQVWEIRDEER